MICKPTNEPLASSLLRTNKYWNILLDILKFWINIKIALKIYPSGDEGGIISVHIIFLNFDVKTNKRGHW